MLKIKNIEKLNGAIFKGVTKDYNCTIKTVGMSIDVRDNDMPSYIIYFECNSRSYGKDLKMELIRKKSVDGTYEMRNNVTDNRWTWYKSDFDNINIFNYKLGLYIEKISNEIFLQQLPF